MPPCTRFKYSNIQILTPGVFLTFLACRRAMSSMEAFIIQKQSQTNPPVIVPVHRYNENPGLYGSQSKKLRLHRNHQVRRWAAPIRILVQKLAVWRYRYRHLRNTYATGETRRRRRLRLLRLLRQLRRLLRLLRLLQQTWQIYSPRGILKKTTTSISCLTIKEIFYFRI